MISERWYETLGEVHVACLGDPGTLVSESSRSAASARVARKAAPRSSSPGAWVVEYKNGKAVRVREYLDPQEALEAAGLEK